ncbi:MAG: ketopantoate reductase C-terminal domain-containing protein, partial [Xanthobacteraceae bacterium]
ANTAIVPFLNGRAHMDFLAARFGSGATLGGQCVISTTLDAEGRILHLNDTHLVSFGERDGSRSTRAEAIAATMTGARFDSRLSTAILQEMWEKWVFIATTAGITCLMRATVGDIVTAQGVGLTTSLLDECSAIAAAQGFAPSEPILARSRTMLTAPGSTFAASMLRDIERGAATEADHIVGDLLRRGGDGEDRDYPLLQIAYTHLKACEARRQRENAPSTAA